MNRRKIREIGEIRVQKHNHSWENISTLKEFKKFGGVRGKMYFCIRLAASQHNNQASLSFCVRFAQSLHKISCTSAIEASFIAFGLHDFCSQNSLNV